MRIIIILLNICFLLTLPFAIYFAFYYQVFFDIWRHFFPDFIKVLDGKFQFQILSYSVISFPLLIIVGNLLSWFWLARKKYNWAFFATLLPIISVLAFLITLNTPLK